MIPHSRPTIQVEDVEAVKSTLLSGMIAEGEMVSRLESVFSRRYQVKTSVAVGSGSQALLLALKALEVERDTEVVIPTYVCPEVLSVVEYLQATPILVDIENDYLVSVEAVKSAVTPRTKAIIVPFVMGIWRDMSSLLKLDVPIIEDWAQCLGYAIDDISRLIGDIAVFSFHATKLIAGGEGGLVVARENYADELFSQKRFRDTVYKTNLYPMTDLQASLVLAQLDRLPDFLKRRQHIADTYFLELEHIKGIKLPLSFRGGSIFFRFPIRLADEYHGTVETLIEEFRTRGVAVRRPVDILLHQLCPDLRQKRFPVAEKLFSSTFSIPIYPLLTDSELESVMSATCEIFR